MAWLITLLAGGMGNYLDALVFSPTYLSIGASTSVFGAIGVLSTLRTWEYYYYQSLTSKIYVPLIAGLGLFAMIGTNLKSDVIAHLMGLISGMFIGISLIPIYNKPLFKKIILQIFFILLFSFLILYSWLTLWKIPLLS